MSIDKGVRVERVARGMFVGAVALACGACGGSRHHGQASAGTGNVAGSVGLGGATSSSGSAGSSGVESDGSDGGDQSEGGESGQGGAGVDIGAAGDGTIESGGMSSGGSNSGGIDAGGTNAGGMGAVGGANSGGTSAGGTSAGGAPASCGDAVLAAAEQCDDGNTKNLDGCNAACKYELVDRMTSVVMQGQGVSAPAFCSTTANALGRAFSSLALGQINTSLQQSISDGTLNNLLHFDGLEDLTGASNDSALAIGVLPAVPDLAHGPWPGGSPLDFWFHVASASVDVHGLPLNPLPGTLTARSLSAGPGLLKLPLAIAGAPSTLSVSNARLRASLSATPAPNVPAPPPSSLAPGLTVFQAITGSGSGQGLCGNVTVESLAHIPAPASLATACLSCTGSRTYTACSGGTVEPGCNSLLDVLVGGCKTLLCAVNVVTPSQPDVPAPGSAAVRPLSIGPGNAVPSGQSAGNVDAYSSYFKFDANRAHITGSR